MRWPWKRQVQKVDQADRALHQAEADRDEAFAEREDAREFGRWVRSQAADRLDAQLRTAFRTQVVSGGQE